MPSLGHTSVTLKVNDGRATVGSLQTTHYDPHDCIKRALQRLGFFWLLAGGSLFIPLAHFVLAPGFLIAGLVTAYLTFKTTQVRNHTTGTCPACNEDIKISMDARDELPKWTYCPVCNAPLRIMGAE
jgi:hypothetical protein